MRPFATFSSLRFLLILPILLASCGGKFSSNNDTRIELSDGQLALSWDGTTYLTGGYPDVQYRSSISATATETDSIFNFYLGDTSYVKVKPTTLQNSNIIILSILPNGNKLLNGGDFSGIFFSNFHKYKRGIAFWRYKPYNSWTKPMKVTSPSNAESSDIQFFIWQHSDGTYGAALPLSGNGYRGTLGSERGSFGSKAVSDLENYQANEIPALAIGFGKDIYTLTEQLYNDALTYLHKEEDLRKNKIFPDVFNYIGWCSWNASDKGNSLNDKLIETTAQSFHKARFSLGWMIIDDGWSDISQNPVRLRSFSPNKDRFPKGFAPVVKTVKEKYGIMHVGVWHALNAYWFGIDKDSPLGKQYGSSLFSWKDRFIPEAPVCYMVSPYSDSLRLFYQQWYTQLKAQGIDMVKVDNQSAAEKMFRGNFPIYEAATAMHKALNVAVNESFNGNIINCMDMTNDAFYNFGTTAVARAVEDYFPYQNKETYNLQKGNAAAHVVQGLYNSLYFQQMVWPDLDMFESNHPYATFHATARALSSGPVYVTDKPGKQNYNVLRPLVFADGKIIRTNEPPRITDDCFFRLQEKTPLKAYSFINGAVVMGVWNASDFDFMDGGFRVSDFKNLLGDKFIAYEYFSKNYSVCSINESQSIKLHRMQCQYYNIVPVQNDVAAIGLVNKYNAPGTILSRTDKEKAVSFTVVEGGTFAVWSAKYPAKILVNGKKGGYIRKKRMFFVQIPASDRNAQIELCW
jgi:raffinose synthase